MPAGKNAAETEQTVKMELNESGANVVIRPANQEFRTKISDSEEFERNDEGGTLHYRYYVRTLSTFAIVARKGSCTCRGRKESQRKCTIWHVMISISLLSFVHFALPQTVIFVATNGFHGYLRCLFSSHELQKFAPKVFVTVLFSTLT